MIYDVFPFFNELDLLEIRLHELSGVVDKFILSEATTTHSGKPKPLYFNENKHLFDAFKDKLVHVIVDLPPGNDHWRRENAQRDCLKQELAKLGAHPDDIVISADADEIVRASTLKAVASQINQPVRMEMISYAYYVTRRSGLWKNCFISRYKNLKNTLSNLRKFDGIPQEYYLPNFGWHFSSVGGVDRIFRKLESFAHQEFNNNPHKAEVAERVAKKGNNCTLEGLPEYLLINKEKFSYLFDQGV